MKKYFFLFVLPIGIALLNACDTKEQPAITSADSITLLNKDSSSTTTIPAPQISDTAALQKSLASFIPAGYKLFDSVSGDLNKDNVPDLVLMIKATDKKNFVNDEYRGLLDRNRRGIIVLLRKNNNYEQLVKNYDCFTSENEDGGVYYAPELDLDIKGGKLYINYSHGRYGYWSYSFRPASTDMELIGYDASSNTGPIINRETSINFLTKKKLVRKNINDDAESGEEKFEETWTTIKAKTPTLLSAIKGFDEMEMHEY